jgi:hypothetical protein
VRHDQAVLSLVSGALDGQRQDSLAWQEKALLLVSTTLPRS